MVLRNNSTSALVLAYLMAVALCDTIPRRSSIFLVTHKNHYHPGPAYGSFSVTCMMECGELCTADLACVSFNLNKTGSGDFQCNLLGEIWEEGKLLPEENMDFYGRYCICICKPNKLVDLL